MASMYTKTGIGTDPRSLFECLLTFFRKGNTMNLILPASCQLSSDYITLGVDIGSTTAKVVAIKERSMVYATNLSLSVASGSFKMFESF